MEEVSQSEFQPQTQAPLAGNQEVYEKTKNSKKILLTILIFLLLLVIGSVSYYLGAKKNKPVDSFNELISATTTPKASLTPTLLKDSELTSVSENRNKYTNSQLNFSINIPKESNFLYGKCEFKDGSYRPLESKVPVKVFEDNENKVVFVSNEYYYQLSGEIKKPQEVGYTSTFSKCDKVMNSLDFLKSSDNFYNSEWKIKIESIQNDQQLETFIKNKYGGGCSLGEKTLSIAKDIYDIQIKGDGKDLGETSCPINYMYVVKYSPTLQKVASWDLGQACTFMEDNNICIDKELVESFRFN